MKNTKTKRILLVVIAVIVVIVVAIQVVNFLRLVSKKLTEAPGEVVVSAICGAVYGTPEDTAADEYDITTDRVFTYKHEIMNVVPDLEIPSVSRTLTQEEYDTFIQIVTRNGVLLLPADITDHDVMDGDYAYLTFTMQDGSKYSTGGYNPDSEAFDEVLSYIRSLLTEEMEAEYVQKYQEYAAVYNEKPLYYDHYQQINEFNLSVTEEQLEKLEYTSSFFLDLEFATTRHFSGEYNRYTNRYKYEDDYELKILDDTAEVYIDGDYVGTIALKDMSEIYKEEIQKYNVTATEEQLRIAGRQFFSDVRHLDQSAYAYLRGSVSWTDDVVSGEKVILPYFETTDYSFKLEDGHWNYYIQGEKAGSTIYIPPME